ncbi:MAG: amidohydrolase, partial [Gemmatimonadota bacterium]|nr:amidohydrolase [Gemmatimonadota bacterium]
ALLADGLYGRWPVPDYGLALHVLPTLEAGQVGYCPGMAMANIDTLDITIHGVGAHGAKPHKARDPIVAAAQLITALQTIVSREIDPAETGVVTVGSIHGGTKHNIIPDKVRLELTVRSFSSEVRKTIIEAIERITIDTCRAAGMPDDKLPEVTVRKDESFVSLYNDPELVERVVKTFRALLGEDNVSKTKPSTYGEDFIEFGMTPEKVPVFMFFLGAADPGSEVSSRPDVHSPYFLPAAEHTLSTGVRAMSAAVLDLLGKG